MKGVVFTLFHELVESKFGLDMIDELIDETNPESGGIYTSTGTYDHAELVSMVVALSQRSGIPVPDLIQAFGEFLFGAFVKEYPVFFERITTAEDFLSSVEGFIHVEVRKLYPDAQLPTFDWIDNGDGNFTMVYSSQRPFADLAHGLIKACVEHFGGRFEVEREGSGTHATFRLQRKSMRASA